MIRISDPLARSKQTVLELQLSELPRAQKGETNWAHVSRALQRLGRLGLKVEISITGVALQARLLIGIKTFKQPFRCFPCIALDYWCSD